MEVLEAIRMRRSVRSYARRAIPEEVVAEMREALRAAPSACNIQPWHFIFVRDPQLRQQLGTAAHDQLWIAEAPIIVVACGWPRQAYPRMGGSGNSVDIDVAIALDHLTLAAVSQGLGTCWIGSFDEDDVKRLMQLPPAGKIVAMTPLGFPARDDLIHPLRPADRKPESELFSQDVFGQR
jgi:nitroreductase